MEIKTILELADKAGFNASELEKGFANLLRQRLIDFANLVEAHDRLAQPEPEPVAWMHEKAGGYRFYSWKKEYPNDIPLYTAPPKRELVGLEDEDVATVKNEFNRGALWAEQVLRNKNT